MQYELYIPKVIVHRYLLSARRLLRIVHHEHKSGIHVKLLVAVQQGRSRVSRDHIHLHLSPPGHQDGIFQDLRGRLSGDAGNLESVAVKVHGMRAGSLIVEDQTVPPVNADDERIGMRERLAIDRPPVARSFTDYQWETAIRLGPGLVAAEEHVIPGGRWRRAPLRRPLFTGILHHDSH